MNKDNASLSLGDLADKIGIVTRPVSMSDIADKIGFKKRPMTLGELDDAVEKYLSKHTKK